MLSRQIIWLLYFKVIS